MNAQLDLLAGLDTNVPDLASYHIILINSSAGKDSLAMLIHLVELADRQGVPRSRIVVVYASLGVVVHPGTLELARAHAQAYGLRFEVVSRAENLMDQIRTRRRTLNAQAQVLLAEAEALAAAGWHRLAKMARLDALKKWQTPAWPSSQARYCTSDQKVAQVLKLITRLVDELVAAGVEGPIRILNCLGIRAEESPDRAKKQPFGRDSASNSKRHVDRWLPIFDWTVEDVWNTIRRSGLPYHPAYDAGLPRLSCVFCVLAGRRELVLAARMYPDLAYEYVLLERDVGHTFRKDVSMAEIFDEANGAAA